MFGSRASPTNCSSDLRGLSDVPITTQALARRLPYSRSRFSAGRIQPIRFHVDQNVRYPVQAFLNRDANLCGDVVRGLYSQVRIHLQMQVDVILHSRLAGLAFLDPES